MSDDYVKRARVGSLDGSVTFERQTSVISPTGSESKTWSALITVRCKAFEMYGKEFIEANQRFSMATTVFAIRYSSAVSTIGSKDRILYKGDYFDIVGFDRKPRNRTKWLFLYAVSGDEIEIHS